MTHVLIVNSNGVLSAMPSLKEFEENYFVTDEKVFGAVHCDADVAALIYQERQRIRVLTPELPGPVKEKEWLYIGVLDGRVALC